MDGYYQILTSDMVDFEDAIQNFTARKEGIMTIIARNEADFERSGLSIYNAESFLKTLN